MKMLLSHLELKISIWLGLADPGHLPPGIQSLDTRQNINIDSRVGEFNDYLGPQFNQNEEYFIAGIPDSAVEDSYPAPWVIFLHVKKIVLENPLANTFSWTMRSGEITRRDLYRLSTRPKLI